MLEGFRRPDWKNIERYINDTFNEELKPTAWDEASIAWVKVLQKDLGVGCIGFFLKVEATKSPQMVPGMSHIHGLLF